MQIILAASAVTRPISKEEIKRHYEWETANVIVELFEDLNENEIVSAFPWARPIRLGLFRKKGSRDRVCLAVIAEMAMKTVNPKQLLSSQQALFEEARLQCLLRSGQQSLIRLPTLAIEVRRGRLH